MRRIDLVTLWILPHGKPSKAEAAPDRHHLFAGLREIARMHHLRGALATVLLTSTFCAPLIVFCPVLVKHALQGDVGDFSLAIGAFGAGGLLGAIALLGIDPGFDRGSSAHGLQQAMASFWCSSRSTGGSTHCPSFWSLPG